MDHDIQILESISQSKEIRQRELAEKVGLSLGMVNSILKRLVKKGWLQIRKINNKNIRYIVSPDGLQAIARKSYLFLKRTLGNISKYREILFSLLSQICQKGYKRIILVGISDLDFLVDHICYKLNLVFIKINQFDSKQEGFFIISEDKLPQSIGTADNIVYLSDILVNTRR